MTATSNAAAAFGVDLLPCDITPYKAGNTGVDYMTIFDSGVAGPHLMINALTHGNEVCGAHALRFLFEKDVRPTRGKLTLSFANIDAYESFNADYPYASRYVDEDFNRIWNEATLDGPRESRELTRGRAMRPVVDTVDHMLDIHSVELPQPAMLLAGSQAKGRTLSAAIGAPRHVVIDAGHAAGKRIRDYAQFDDPSRDSAACLVECGYHFYKEAADIAVETSLRFLRHHDAIDPTFLAEHLGETNDEEQLFIEVSGPVTVETDNFVFDRVFEGFEIVPDEGTLIGTDDGRKVRTPYANCVMIMPAREPVKGKTAVRLGRLV
ncbi:MAG: succinylglutamate desuccinylase [Rhodospirillaceae bacterium]|nr:succinylglutamate desuccinylase [Rhodospirillaceae bacterium]|tara:strand:+ start:4245 stop:5210 length:966 start_codon:yes stop_codon:yes gene_type:complete